MDLRRYASILILISIVLGCASTKPFTKYLPEQQENVFPFFTSGQPIGAIETAEAFLLLSLEPTYVAGRPYIRLWMLYQNTSDKPYLLEPLQFVTLTSTHISKDKSKSSQPESPTKILAHISNDKAATMIMQAIGGTLEQMAVKPTTTRTETYEIANGGVRTSTAITTVDDESKKRGEIHDRTVNAMMNTAIWYELYQSSVSEGILRRNTIFPTQSVNGYIYFPFSWPGGLDWGYRRYRDQDLFLRSMDYIYSVSFVTAEGDQDIKFVPIEGE